MTYVSQDFTTTTGELIDVGLNYSDDDLTVPPQVYRDAPYAWLTIEASDRLNWNAAIAELQANPPEGWREYRLLVGSQPLARHSFERSSVSDPFGVGADGRFCPRPALWRWAGRRLLRKRFRASGERSRDCSTVQSSPPAEVSRRSHSCLRLNAARSHRVRRQTRDCQGWRARSVGGRVGWSGRLLSRAVAVVQS
jgi:hypothetical protein